LIIPDPEFASVQLDGSHEFLIMASDGLWDVISPEDAVKRVRMALNLGKLPKAASEELCALALKLGSGDNITVIIVQFYCE
jgi:serine/threonine protein phosphatase PrpC